VRKSLALKKPFALQYLLSTIPNGFDQIPLVDFKLRWKRPVKIAFFGISSFPASLCHGIPPRRDELCLSEKRVFCSLILAFLGSQRVRSDFFYRLRAKVISILQFSYQIVLFLVFSLNLDMSSLKDHSR